MLEALTEKTNKHLSEDKDTALLLSLRPHFYCMTTEKKTECHEELYNVVKKYTAVTSTWKKQAPKSRKMDKPLKVAKKSNDRPIDLTQSSESDSKRSCSRSPFPLSPFLQFSSSPRHTFDDNEEGSPHLKSPIPTKSPTNLSPSP